MKVPGIKKWLSGVVLIAIILSGITKAPLRVDAQDPERVIRLHFAKDTLITTETVWTWGDVINPSSSWPQGDAIEGSDDVDYPFVAHIKVKEDAKQFSFLVVKANEEKRTDDITIDVISETMEDLYLDQDFNVHYTKERVPEGKVRIHYLDTERNYIRNHFYGYGYFNIDGANQWGDFLALYTSNPGLNGVSGDFDWSHEEPFEQVKTGFFSLVPTNDGDRSHEWVLQSVPESRELFVKEGDTAIYDNPYYVTKERLTGAEQISNDTIKLSFNDTSKYDAEGLKVDLVFYNDNEVVDFDAKINFENDAFVVQGDFLETKLTHIELNGVKVKIMVSWKYIDTEYYYDGDLGATLHDDGSASIKLWSPSADAVSVVLYDKDDQTKLVGRYPMLVSEGVWSTVLDQSNTGLDTLRNYVYHLEVTRNGETVTVLDPYAKSLSQWNSNNEAGDKIAKAAIVNPSVIGPDLEFAKIEGYETREDAIIYELHVRDFTSDPSIDKSLKSQFGTFASFVEKLDYIEDLGITHIQLLPIMSYYFANEFNTQERMLEYESENTDYNWGYDPQSYFALTGMYSEDASNPEKRIEEFKNLVDEIHRRGMGVILDVVYNHTAQTSIFEDLEPNYYHFMDADGTPRTSFGGGRLGTSHLMSRRVLVDSIKYLVDEYKVDGFRFDMMGDHDAETIQIAFDEAKAINPNVLMIGEGWVTYAGDENESLQAADQQWMQFTQAVGSFSDEIRNELKSGFGSEGQARFLTNGARNIGVIFNNMIARPGNFLADDPGDVVQYIEAHDNLTLYDVIAQSIKKDPALHDEEILKRVRIGNTMILTAQGTSFIHGGQEYGRTKQYLADTDVAPYKSTFMSDENGVPFTNPYFIHDSYDSSDIINRFDWEKATNSEAYPLNVMTRDHMKGIIAIRRSTDAFSYSTNDLVDQYVSQVLSDDIKTDDLVFAMKNVSKENGDIFYTFINADMEDRTINFKDEIIDLDLVSILSNGDLASVDGVEGNHLDLSETSITLKPLSTVIIKVAEEAVVPPIEVPMIPLVPSVPKVPLVPLVPAKPGVPVGPVVPVQPDVPEVPKDDDTLPNTGVHSSNAVSAALGLIATGILIIYVRRKQSYNQ